MSQRREKFVFSFRFLFESNYAFCNHSRNVIKVDRETGWGEEEVEKYERKDACRKIVIYNDRIMFSEKNDMEFLTLFNFICLFVLRQELSIFISISNRKFIAIVSLSFKCVD
jgi:hypothetical protein